jgi:hypothetical protein
MNRKLLALIILAIALFGIAYNIERTARPPNERIGVPQVDTGEHDD